MKEVEMKREKRSPAGCLLILLGLLVAAAGVALLFLIPDGCDYVVSAPSFSAENPVKEELNKVSELLEVPFAAALRQQGTQVSTERAGRQTATVYAVSEGYFDIAHETLSEGRLLNGEEVRGGARVALVNRKGAEALFPGLEVPGQKLKIGETDLEVVGVLAGGFRPGEKDEILIFVPIALADSEVIRAQTLEVKTMASGTEEKALLANRLKSWNAEGNLQDSERLRLAALMPLWLVGCGFGLFLLRRLLRRLGAFTRRQGEWFREQLRNQYVSQILPMAIGRGLLLLALLAAWIGAAWLLVSVVALPLYTFTDWIPDSPADPASWITMGKNLMTAAASATLRQNRAAGAAGIRAGVLIFLVGLVPFKRVRREETA